jgi:hypothetical protein
VEGDEIFSFSPKLDQFWGTSSILYNEIWRVLSLGFKEMEN